jgi:hypothetical protein
MRPGRGFGERVKIRQERIQRDFEMTRNLKRANSNKQASRGLGTWLLLGIVVIIIAFFVTAYILY